MRSCLRGRRALRHGMLIALAVAGPADAWLTRIPGVGLGDLMAVDPAGNIFVSTRRLLPRQNITSEVVKLAARSGHELWRRSLLVPGDEHSDEVYGLRIMPGGDVLAAAGVETAGRVEFTVLRLRAADGQPGWVRTVAGERPSTFDLALAVDVDARGDVVAAGTIEGPTVVQYHGTSDFFVVKLGGDDGAERWRLLLDGTAHENDVALGVAADAAGDVIAVGILYDAIAEGPLYHQSVPTAVKLDGGDGHLIWRTTLAGLPYAMSVARNSDVLIAGDPFAVTRLSGTTGASLWSRKLAADPRTSTAALAVVELPSGDIATGGFLEDPDKNGSAVVATFAGATGEERWRQLLQGTDGFGSGDALAVTANGDVLVGGQLRNKRSCYDALAARLSASTGDVVERRMLDGRSQASQCEVIECDRPPCGAPRAGIDQDFVATIGVGRGDRVTLVGSLSDGRRGQRHAFVASWRSLR